MNLFPYLLIVSTIFKVDGADRTVFASDTLPQCGTILCTADYDPICGKRNGVKETFSNSCNMFAQNLCVDGEKWKFLYEGTCNTSDGELKKIY